MSLLLGYGPPRFVRLRAGTVPDTYGDPVESWDPEHVQRLPLPGARAQVRDVVEEEGLVHRVIRRERVLYMPGTPDVRAEDRIEEAGEVWRIDGDPVVRTRLSGPPETVATLTRKTG